MVVLSFLKASEVIPSGIANAGIGFVAITNSLMTAFCAYLITGTITWIVSQTLAVPLRPIKLRASLIEARKKWKTFAGLGIASTFLSILAGVAAALIAFAVPAAILWVFFGMQAVTVVSAGVIGSLTGVTVFLLTSVWLALVAPVVMMENLRGVQALKRSKALVSRSLMTAFAAYIIMFLIPAVAAGSLSFVINITAKALDKSPPIVETTETRKIAPANQTPDDSVADQADKKDDLDLNISFGNGRRVNVAENPKDMRGRLKDTILETLLQILLLPIQIVVISFTGIIVALLYLKTRQAGGESLQDLLSKFEETDKPRKKWQERVRQRLIQSGRITSRS